jgi:PelA/Pel-15E family pectate lyase
MTQGRIMPLKPALIALLLAAAPAALCAAEIGRMEPAPPLTRAHIMADAPAAERAAWLAYLERSQAFARAEKASMFAERVGMSAVPAAPATGNPDESMPTDRPAAWYAGPEAKAVAANILSFQSPTGGWSKNQDRRTPPRVKGQYYVAGEAGESWSNWGTFDNGATQKEMAFLARVQAQYPGPEGDAYRAAFLKGVTYILVSQYPNGAWPQIYPLMGGYHDALTYNDDAFANQATLLRRIEARAGDYAFVPADVARAAGAAADRSIAILLKSQVVIDGRKTIWAQQIDPITLEPVGARNFEPPALAAAESAGLLVYLMQQENPSKEMREAVHAGVAWLKARAIPDVDFTRIPTDPGRVLVKKPGAGPLWSRYYDLKTQTPIFGDRDQTIHDDIMTVGPGRRNGYSWYNANPKKAVEMYDGGWAAKHPA